MPGSEPSRFEHWGFGTSAAHAGEHLVTGEFQPTSTPIYNASGYFMPSFDALDEVFDGRRPGYFYSRNANPTVAALESAVSTLEGAADTVAFASGMAAIHAAFVAAGLRPGERVVASRDCYGLTRTLLTSHFAEQGVQVQFVDLTDASEAAEAMATRPRVVYLETISNPLLKILNVPALAAAARAAGALTVVDNTFPSPYLARPIQWGADIVVHSATKYLGGHGDVTGGTASTADPELGGRLRRQAVVLGSVLGPNEAWLCHRGLKTLPLRMKQQCQNASVLAGWLSGHSQVARVYYPGLGCHPGHVLAAEMFGGRFGAMVSFDLADPRRVVARQFMDALELIAPAPTLGDLRSLVMYPPLASHRGLTPAQRAEVGIGDGLIRLSVGIEDAPDIIDDVRRGLAACGV